METRADRRWRKLRELCTPRGADGPTPAGIQAVARRAGLNWQSLDQVLKRVVRSTGSISALGDKSAHAIEDAFKLGRGWFDTDMAVPAQSAAAGAPPLLPVTDSEWGELQPLVRNLLDLPDEERAAEEAYIAERAERARALRRARAATAVPEGQPRKRSK